MSLQLLEDRVDTMGGPGMISLPAEICGWHRGHFIQLVSGPPSAPTPSSSSSRHKNFSTYPMQSRPLPALYPGLTPGWWKIPSLLCLHCKKITTPLRFFTENVAKSRGGKGESMKKFCEKMVLWRSCEWCHGCADCGLIEVEVFVRIVRGYMEEETNSTSHENAEDETDIGIEAAESYENQIFAGEPGRFVIYRRNGESRVREWETRKHHHLPPPSQ